MLLQSERESSLYSRSLGSKGTLGGFGSVSYKHISISCHSKVVLDFLVPFDPLGAGFKNGNTG